MWHWFENPISEQNRFVTLQPLDNNDNIFVAWQRTVNWGFPDTLATIASAMEYVGAVVFGVYSSNDKTWHYYRKSYRYSATLDESNNIFLAVPKRPSLHGEYQLIADGYFFLEKAGEAGERWEMRISGTVYSPENRTLLPLRDKTVDTKEVTIQGVNIYY